MEREREKARIKLHFDNFLIEITNKVKFLNEKRGKYIISTYEMKQLERIMRNCSYFGSFFRAESPITLSRRPNIRSQFVSI